MDTLSSSNPGSASNARYREAAERVAHKMRALDAADLLVVNVDVPLAVTTALGALHALAELRPRVVVEAPGIDLSVYDSVEDCTLAFAFAQGEYRNATSPSDALPEWHSQGVVLRDMLLTDAKALSKRKLLDANLLHSYQGLVGYRNVAFDLMGLAQLFRANWSVIASRTGVQLTELDQAESLADDMLVAVGERERSPAFVAEAAVQRQRAFTLFLRTYDLARRVATFLCWDEGDVDVRVPSLYSGRSQNKRRTDVASKGESASSSKGKATVDTAAIVKASALADSIAAAPAPIPHESFFARAGAAESSDEGVPNVDPFGRR